jgi:type IV secretion system protein VirB2
MTQRVAEGGPGSSLIRAWRVLDARRAHEAERAHGEGCPRGADRVQAEGTARLCWPAIRAHSGAAAKAAALAAAVALLATPPAWAGTGGADLPWNQPLQTVVDNLTGPTAKTISALAFVLGGAMWMFTSHEQGAKRFGQALFGVAIVLGAVNLVNALGFQGALFSARGRLPD